MESSLKSSSYLRALGKVKKLYGELFKSLKSKRLVFTVSNGRSGTGYLAGLLSNLNSLIALHEPEPNFVLSLRRATSDLKTALSFLVKEKLPFIASLNTSIYCETSHLFNKAFIFPMLDLELPFELILLKRDRRKTAKSMFELNTIPGRDKVALLYYLKPDDKTVFLKLENWERLTDYQLCYWHALETEKRMEVFSAFAPSYLFDLEEITTFDGALRLLKALSIPVSEGEVSLLREKVGKKVNQKSSKKVRSLFKELSVKEVEEQEREVEELVGYGGLRVENLCLRNS